MAQNLEHKALNIHSEFTTSMSLLVLLCTPQNRNILIMMNKSEINFIKLWLSKVRSLSKFVAYTDSTERHATLTDDKAILICISEVAVT